MVKSGVYQKQEPPIDEESLQPYQMRYRWVILACALFGYSAFGAISRSLGPLITPILEDLNISYSQMGIIMGAWPLAYIPVAIIAGGILDRWGIRKAFFAGIVIVSLSAALRYFATGFVTMFFIVALFGVGGPMISVGGPKAIAVWFREKQRGTAYGIYLTGPKIGGLLSLALTNSLVMPLVGYSWRLAFVFWGSLCFAAALLWGFLARDVKPAEETKGVGIVTVFKDLFGIRQVQLILIMGFLSFAVFHGFNDWLPQVLERGGLSPVMAGFQASVVLAVGIPAVLISSHLTPPRLRGKVVTLLSVVDAIAVLLVVTTSGFPLFAGIILFGAAKAAILPLLLLIMMDLPEVGSKYMGLAGGMFFSVAEIGGFAGPLLLGVFRDMSGGFLTGTAALAVMSLTVGVMALWLKIQPAYDTEASS